MLLRESIGVRCALWATVPMVCAASRKKGWVTMRYQMRQTMLSVGNDGEIFDSEGNVVYYADGKFWTIQDRVDVKDSEGNVVAKLHSKLLTLQKTFVIEIGGQEVATIVRKFFSFRMNFDIHLASGDRWELHGSWSDHAFTITNHDGETIATISSKWVTILDAFGIDIADGQDDLLVLMVLVALEAAESNDTSALA